METVKLNNSLHSQKNRIFLTISLEHLVVNDHFSQLFVSPLDSDNEKKKIAQNLYRDTKIFSRALLNKRIASTDWRAMYPQKDANSKFQILLDLFKIVLKNLAPLKIGQPNKKWISKELLQFFNKNIHFLIFGGRRQIFPLTAHTGTTLIDN